MNPYKIILYDSIYVNFKKQCDQIMNRNDHNQIKEIRAGWNNIRNFID